MNRELQAGIISSEAIPYRENKLVVDPFGAHVTHLTLDGELVLGTFERGDKPGQKKASHPCTPIFGSEGKQSETDYGIEIQHGKARASTWVEEGSGNVLTLSHEIHDGNYPRGVLVRQQHVLLPNSYELNTEHINGSGKRVPVNFAEHFYFNSPEGWEGIHINGTDVSSLVRNDKPYPHVIPMLPVNTICLPGMPTINIEQEGMPHAVLWVGSEGNVKDRHYVTIELCEGNPFEYFFGSTESMIDSGDFRATKIRISIKR